MQRRMTLLFLGIGLICSNPVQAQMPLDGQNQAEILKLMGELPSETMKNVETLGKILQQDSTVATGAGHHSVLRSGDRWYMVYHRRPLGETDRNHRVVSVDIMEFDDRGFIRPVRITKAGVERNPIRD